MNQQETNSVLHLQIVPAGKYAEPLDPQFLSIGHVP